MSQKFIVSRIQQRRGTVDNLPLPLREAELGLTTDTRQVWMGEQDLAPFGVRTHSPGVTLSEIDDVLENQVVTLVFPGPLSESLFRDLNRHFRNQIQFDVGNNPLLGYFSLQDQLSWDGNCSVVFGFRVTEADWLRDNSGVWAGSLPSTIKNIFEQYPLGFPGGTPSILAGSNQFQTNNGSLDWTEAEQGFSILNFNNADMSRRIGQLIASTVNVVASPTRRRRRLLSQLGNIELGVVNDFSDDVLGDSDMLTTNVRQSILRASSTSYGKLTEFDLSESDVVFLDYSLNGGTFTATGTLVAVRDSADRVALSDSRVASFKNGSIDFDAESDGSRLLITFRNTTGRETTMRYITRRWHQDN